jgi:hypothetical protein
MPIRIPSGLYARGATFDTTPFTNVVLKDIASKDAAKKAVAKSADDLYKGLNPAGVRPQDLQYPQDNTKGILPDMVNWYNNAKAGNIDFGKYKEMLYNIERSKQIAKEQLEIGGMVQQGKIEPDEKYGDVTKLHEKDLSIYDAGHNDWKQGDLSPFIPELDETKWNNSIFGSAKPQERVEKKRFDASTGRYFIPKEFTTAEEKRFGDTAASLVINDKSANKQFTKQTRNLVFLADAIPVYKEVYGVDYNQKPEEFTADKAAAAAAILEARKRKDVVSYDKPTDPYALAKYKSGLSRTGGGKGAIDEYIKALGQTSEPLTVNNKPFVGLTISGKTYGGKLVQMTPDLIKTFTIDPGLTSEKIPYGMLFTDDGKYVIPTYFQKGEKGGFIPTESGASYKLEQTKFSKPIPMPQFRDIIGKSLGETTSGNLRARDIADEDAQETKTTYTSEGSKQQGKQPKQVSVPELNNYMTD